MNRTLSLLSPAKLNLFLHITGQRPNGYHELQTVFQLLDWGDHLHFAVTNTGHVELAGSELDIPVQENLIMRAANLLHRENLGVTITLEKHIPTGGGLGGGSSDAATTLLALNHLWELGLSRQELATMGAQLGADVPVFVQGHSAWAEGIGDILSPLDLPESWFLIAVPACHVSTKEIFSHQQLTRNSSPIKMAAFFEGNSRNDTQPLVRSLYPEVDKALILLGNFGEARLTGTGACVYVRFDDEAAARAAREQLPTDCDSILAKGVNHSPVLAALV